MLKRVLIAVLLCLNVATHHVIHEAQVFASAPGIHQFTATGQAQTAPGCEICKNGQSLTATFVPAELVFFMTAVEAAASPQHAPKLELYAQHSFGRAPPSSLSLA